LAVLPVAVLLALFLGASYGAVSIPLPEVVQIVLDQLGLPLGHSLPAWQVDIVWNLRMPEVTAALLVGAALSLAGAIFQAVLRNPLADPFVIGTSSGAVLGVAIAYVASAASFAWLGFGTSQIFAFAGSLAAVSLVYALARVGRRVPTLTFLLAGFAVSTLMVAAMWLVAYESGNSTKVLIWTMGSLSYSTWAQLALIAPAVGLLFAASLFFVRDLNAMLLGEDQASYLGVHAERSKLLLIGLAALLTSLAVSLAGIIGFVGLVVPHIARLLYGANHRVVLAASVFLGAAYLAFSDLAARTLQGSGGELPLGIVTAVIGGPVFLFLLRRSGAAYEF
jgi:iron complex transport system permease protein